jgi:large subunit ribosomal protein L30
MAQETIRIRLKASPTGSATKLKLVVKGLGLRKINQVVVKPDTPGFRGMVAKIPHLVEIVKEQP